MTQVFEQHSAIEPIRTYFYRVRMILSSPRVFFREMPITGGLSGPLAFALVTHWLATAARHFWIGIIGEKALPLWQKLLTQFTHQESAIDNIGRLPWFNHSHDIVMDWFWQAGPIVIDPFLTLGKTVLMSLVIFVGARVVVPSRSEYVGKITFESVLRILCFAMATNLIVIFPIVGSQLAWLFRFVITVVAFFEVYRIGIGRALVITLFPYVLVLATISIAMLGSVALIIRMFIGS